MNAENNTGFSTLFNGTVSVPKYETGVLSKYFYCGGPLPGIIGEFSETLLSLQNCTKINLGLTDLSTSTPKSLAWHKDVTKNSNFKYTIDGSQVTNCGFRTSVYDIPNASARILLEGKNIPKG